MLFHSQRAALAYQIIGSLSLTGTEFRTRRA